MVFTKEHLQALPVREMPFAKYPRDSKLLSISIPLFHSEKGWVGAFDEDRNFNIDLFRDIYIKGAAWVAYSIATNTDLCERGVPIYFHIEDKVYEACQDRIEEYGIPDDWIRVTSFEEPAVEIEHPRHGKKHYVFADPEIDTDIIGLWDADALVYRPPGVPKLNWYEKFEKLGDTIITSYFSDYNGGDQSFANWIRLAADLPQLDEEVTHENDLYKSRIESYQKVGLEPTNKQCRYGSMLLFVPKDSGLRTFLAENHEFSYADEALVSMWMNSVGQSFQEFEKVFLPIVKSDEELSNFRDVCIAHPDGVAEHAVKYQKRLEIGIDGLNRPKQIAPRGRRLRFHIFSVPHNPSHKDYSCCAFAQKARKLAWMLHNQGHEVFHYGNELSEVTCTEHIDVTTEADLTEAYGDFRDQSDFYQFAETDYVYKMYNLRVEHEVRKRAVQDDYFCYPFAPFQRRLYYNLQDMPVHHIESGIGYFDSYMKFRVFESPALRAYHYGYYGNNSDRYWELTEEEKQNYEYDPNTHIHYSDPPLWDAVIPNSFDVEDFDFRVQKEDYFLYLGRIIKHKGLEEAMRIADAVGKKLIVAGQGDFEQELGFEPWDNVEIVGRVDVETRKELISKAAALFCISRYWEPFGGVHIEAMLSGTPPISSDFGGFIHTIRSGYNGYRLGLNVYEQGIWAVNNLDKLDPYNLRDFGLRFSNEQIALRYDEYFDSLTAMIQNDCSPYWIENPNRTDLDWLDYDRDIEWQEGWMTPVDDSEVTSEESDEADESDAE